MLAEKIVEDISYEDGSDGKKEWGEGRVRGENNLALCKWEKINNWPRKSKAGRDDMFEPFESFHVVQFKMNYKKNRNKMNYNHCDSGLEK